LIEAVPGDEIEVGEATLAVVGFTNVIKGEMPRIGVEKQRAILDLNKTIDGLALDFVYDRLPKKLSMPRPFTYRKLLDQFTKPLPQATLMDLHKKFPRDAADIELSFMSTLQSAYAHLGEMVPVADIDTYLGPKRIAPTSDKTFEFFNSYWVIDTPLVVFQLMQCGGLNPEQVTAFLKFYPSLHNYMKKAILEAIVKRNHAEPSFMFLPPRADRGLATFKQQRIVPYGVNVHTIEPKPTQGEPPPPKLRTTLQTAGQKAAEL